MALTSGASSQRGAVLALVLFMLAAISLLLIGLTRDLLLDHSLSSGMRASLNAHLFLDSAQRLAAAVLVRNSRLGDPDRLGERDWGQFDAYLEAFSVHAQTSDFRGTITDENSRFPLMALIPRSVRDEKRAEAFSKLFVRLVARQMLAHGYDADFPEALRRAEQFLEGILEWCGLTPLEAKAAAWYRSQTPARLPPGRALLGPEELLLVRWQDMDEAFVRRLVMGTPDRPGLADLLTFWGSGPLNVNTAFPEILEALSEDPASGSAFAAAVVRERALPDATLEELWYRDLALRHGIRLDVLPAEVLDVRSRWYRLEIVVAGGTRKGIAIGWVTNEYVQWEYQAIR